MSELLLAGLSLLGNPDRGWRRIHEQRPDAIVLLMFAVLVATVPMIFKIVGHMLAGLGIGVAVANSLLFVIIVVGAAAGAGVIIAAVSRRMGDDIDDLTAQTVALTSAMPILVMGPLYGIPALALHPYILLASLGWSAFLLFRGVWLGSRLDARAVTIISLVASSAWILAAAILTQVLLLVLVAS